MSEKIGIVCFIIGLIIIVLVPIIINFSTVQDIWKLNLLLFKNSWFCYFVGIVLVCCALSKIK